MATPCWRGDSSQPPEVAQPADDFITIMRANVNNLAKTKIVSYFHRLIKQFPQQLRSIRKLPGGNSQRESR